MLRFFKNETTDATLLRKGAGAYIDGDWTPDPEVSSAIRIIVPQPVTSNELFPLPDGEKVSNFRVTWCADFLRTRDDGSDPDVIEYEGKRYEIYQVDERNVLGNFYRVVMREEL